MPSDACLSSDTVDLIVQLCCSADERLGGAPGAAPSGSPRGAPGGACDVKAHPFFTGIHFDSLRHQRAPYVPHLRYATDTSHFETSEPDDRLVRRSASLDSLLSPSNTQLPPGTVPSSCDGGRHAFLEFTFRRFFDADGHAHATRLTDGPAPVYV